MKIGDIILFTTGSERSWGLGILLDECDLNYDQVYKIYFPNKNIQLLYTKIELVGNTINISKRS